MIDLHWLRNWVCRLLSCSEGLKTGWQRANKFTFSPLNILVLSYISSLNLELLKQKKKRLWVSPNLFWLYSPDPQTCTCSGAIFAHYKAKQHRRLQRSTEGRALLRLRKDYFAPSRILLAAEAAPFACPGEGQLTKLEVVRWRYSFKLRRAG